MGAKLVERFSLPEPLSHVGSDRSDGRWPPLHRTTNTFPGEVLLELAADAPSRKAGEPGARSSSKASACATFPKTGLTSGPSSTQPSTRCGRRWFGLGSIPGLLDEVSWWRTDDLWFWALQALVTHMRAPAEHRGETVPAICGRIASRHGVQLAVAT